MTGASGFVGGHVVEALHAAGHQVRAIYRRALLPPHLAALERDGVQLLRVDLTQPHTATTAVAGMDVVIHAAARADYFGPAPSFFRDNVAITADLLEAARKEGCRRFVQISSIAVHGFGAHRATTEFGPYYPLRDPYSTTKWQAEQLVLEANSPDLRTVALRPSNVYGPRDTTVTRRVLDTLAQGFLPVIDGGGQLTSLLYIDDLVAAILASLDNAAVAGKALNICNPELVTMVEVLEAGATLLGYRLRRLRLPRRVARIAAGIAEAAAHLPGVAAPSLTRPLVEQLSHDFNFSDSLAVRLLGVGARTAWREGVLRTLRAFFPERQLDW